MNRTLQQSFANRYPQRSAISSLDLVPEKPKIKEKYNGTTKKSLWVVILIAGIAALIFSSAAYTVSNYVFEYFHIDMFNAQNEPTIAIQIIHAIVLAVIVYIILYYR